MHRICLASAAVFVCVFTSSSVFASTIPGWGGEVLSSDPVFNFDSDVAGTPTPFTDIDSGLSATFSSSGDPGGFAIIPPIQNPPPGFPMTGSFLSDPGPARLAHLTLTIVFSAVQTSISMDFLSNMVVPLTLNAFDDATPVGSTVAPAIPMFSAGVGVISFSPFTFNRVVLSSSSDFFAIDNVTVSGPALPEPDSLSLFVSGAVSLIGITRRRRAKAQPADKSG